jgi:hypothetical protein
LLSFTPSKRHLERQSQTIDITRDVDSPHGWVPPASGAIGPERSAAAWGKA